MSKVAQIHGTPIGTDETGRCLYHSFSLYLNDNGGKGFWHGGPSYPNHCKPLTSLDEGKELASKWGYELANITYS